jgi:hypothetical protein
MRRALTIFVWTATLLLGAVTATANFRYGWLVAHGEERWIYAVGGTVLDVVKTFLPVMLGTFLVGRLTLGTFFRGLAGWTIWAVGVVWSLSCALGLYAITKEAGVGDAVGQQTLHKQLTGDKATKQDQLKVLNDARAAEVIDGEIAVQKRDRLWDRTQQCADATVIASRTFCAKIDALDAERRAARPAADIQRERATLQAAILDIETKLSGINLSEVMKSADPATEALGKLLGWDAGTVKARLALLLACLFEGVSLLPWIITGSHGAPKREEPEAAAMEPVLPVPAKAEPRAEPEIVLPEVESLVATWAKAAVVRRKGSFTLSRDVRSDFEAWCRANGHETMNATAFGKEMTRLGFEGRKVGGVQRYLDISLLPKARELRIVADNTVAAVG